MADIDMVIQKAAGARGLALAYRTDTQASDPISTTDRFLFPNSGREYVLIKKGTGTVDVTIDVPVTVDGLAVADRTVAVAANESRLLGPFDPSVYNNGDGKVALSFSAAGAISVAVLRV